MELKFKKNYIIELAPTLNEHWYKVMEGKKDLGYFPSATTILNAYPQGAHLTKWIAENGWNEAQRILSEAGERGTKVHNAVEFLLNGHTLRKIDYSLDEWRRIEAFTRWYGQVNLEVIALEVAVFSKKYGYSGRFDCLGILDGKLTVIDWKTSGSMYPHFPLQFACYAQAIEETTDLKIEQTMGLQLGTKSKDGFKEEVHTNWKADFEIFKSVKKTWEYDRFGSKKKKNAMEAPVLILPDSLKLELKEANGDSV